MAKLIDRFGPCTWTLRSMESPFAALLRSIVFQQLSTPSASAIYGRVEDLFDEGSPRPEVVLQMDEDTLRACGVSRPKIGYIRDLAEKTLSGDVPALEDLVNMPDEEILNRLSRVRGVGRWTVEMLLMFNLGRPDVLPSTDLVIRRGFSEIYGWDELPTHKELETYGERWRPFRSVACWYIWRYEDGDNAEW